MIHSYYASFVFCFVSEFLLWYILLNYNFLVWLVFLRSRTRYVVMSFASLDFFLRFVFFCFLYLPVCVSPFVVASTWF